LIERVVVSPAFAFCRPNAIGYLTGDRRRGELPTNRETGRGEFGGEFLPAEYGMDVRKLRHRRPVSVLSPAEVVVG